MNGRDSKSMRTPEKFIAFSTLDARRVTTLVWLGRDSAEIFISWQKQQRNLGHWSLAKALEAPSRLAFSTMRISAIGLLVRSNPLPWPITMATTFRGLFTCRVTPIASVSRLNE